MKNVTNKFVIPISFDTRPTEDIPLLAFLFSRTGKLLEKKSVKDDSVDFKVTANPRLYLVYVAPAVDRAIETITSVDELERYKPYQLVLDVSREGSIRPIKIPGEFSKLWLYRYCRVRGRVIKHFALGDLGQYRGICHARVHICEVDRIWWWINKIPDRIIAKIPEIVVRPEWPIPIPDPEPFDPGWVGLNPQPEPPTFTFDAPSEFSANLLQNSVAARAPMKSASLDMKSATTEALSVNSRSEMQAANEQQQQQKMASAQTAILASPALMRQLQSGNLATIRTALVENFALFHPYFCVIPWLWPYFYRCDQVALAYTDQNGAFDTHFWYKNDGDQPDLYFWVEYLIDGVWTCVYKPSIPCHTYWNYVCGSEVTLRVTDPRVRWECNDILDGDIVWIKTIGYGASVSRIQQQNALSIIQGVPFNHIGLTDAFNASGSSALDRHRRPFGSHLNFIVQFGSGLPSNGMYYYRWSYRKLRHADLSPAPYAAPLSLHKGQALYKSYTYEYYDAALHKHFGTNSFKLGPVSKNGEDDLFVIPPVFPASAPVNASEQSPLWDQNTITASVDSSQFSDGLYEFILELFDVHGHKLASIPRQIFQVPQPATFSPSIDAPDDYVLLNSATTAHHYKMVMRIDNQPCKASVYKIKVNGAEVTSDCCGFVSYPPNASIEVAFRAYHPHNFANFTFTVQKGTCNDGVQQGFTNTSGMVLGSTANYARDGASIYRHSFTPAQLLGVCVDGGKAAFAEYVYVSALATNGTQVLTGFDASALAAFALEPS